MDLLQSKNTPMVWIWAVSKDKQIANLGRIGIELKDLPLRPPLGVSSGVGFTPGASQKVKNPRYDSKFFNSILKYAYVATFSWI